MAVKDRSLTWFWYCNYPIDFLRLLFNDTMSYHRSIASPFFFIHVWDWHCPSANGGAVYPIDWLIDCLIDWLIDWLSTRLTTSYGYYGLWHFSKIEWLFLPFGSFVILSFSRNFSFPLSSFFASMFLLLYICSRFFFSLFPNGNKNPVDLTRLPNV